MDRYRDRCRDRYRYLPLAQPHQRNAPCRQASKDPPSVIKISPSKTKEDHRPSASRSAPAAMPVTQRNRSEAYPVDVPVPSEVQNVGLSGFKKPKKADAKRSLLVTFALTLVVWVVTLAAIVVSGAVKTSEVSKLIWDTATFARTPITAGPGP